MTVRLADQADVPAILEFYRRLSPESVAMRFFVTRQDDPVLARAARIDPARSLVVVAVTTGPAGDRVVAEARCELTDDGEAEFGLAVSDDHQHRGQGRMLLQELRRLARARGIERLRGVVRTDNQPMLRMLLAVGCAIVEPAAGGEVTVDVSTGPGMPGWPTDHRQPRVLVESRGWWSTAEAAALRRAGYAVRQCQGPSARTGRPCALLVSGQCRLVAEADVVACLLPGDDADCVAVAEDHDRQRAGRLVRTSGHDLVAEVEALVAAASRS